MKRRLKPLRQSDRIGGQGCSLHPLFKRKYAKPSEENQWPEKSTRTIMLNNLNVSYKYLAKLLFLHLWQQIYSVQCVGTPNNDSMSHDRSLRISDHTKARETLKDSPKTSWPAKWETNSKSHWNSMVWKTKFPLGRVAIQLQALAVGLSGNSNLAVW